MSFFKKLKNSKKENTGSQEKKWSDQEGELAIDLYKTDSEIVLQSAIAGVKVEDLDILMENDVLSIRGCRKNPGDKEKKDYFYQECYWGNFSREIILPEEIDPSRVEAVMKEGVLIIRAPKIERLKKRKIVIKK